MSASFHEPRETIGGGVVSQRLGPEGCSIHTETICGLCVRPLGWSWILRAPAYHEPHVIACAECGSKPCPCGH